MLVEIDLELDCYKIEQIRKKGVETKILLKSYEYLDGCDNSYKTLIIERLRISIEDIVQEILEIECWQ
jgi:hypothetical protein